MIITRLHCEIHGISIDQSTGTMWDWVKKKQPEAPRKWESGSLVFASGNGIDRPNVSSSNPSINSKAEPRKEQKGAMMARSPQSSQAPPQPRRSGPPVIASHGGDLLTASYDSRNLSLPSITPQLGPNHVGGKLKMLKGKLAAMRPRRSSKVRNLTEKSCSDGYLSLGDDLSKEMKRLLVDEDGSQSGIFSPDSSSDRASLGGGILSRKLPPTPSSERMERKKLRFDTSQVTCVGLLSGQRSSRKFCECISSACSRL